MKNDPDDRFMIETPKLPNITDHASRVVDMIKMRALDITPRHVMTDVMVDLNVRFMQYEKQYKSDPFDFLIIQTIQDYRKWIHPRYELGDGGILLRSRPVGIVIADNRPVYANPAIVRSDFENGIMMLFINKIETGEE